MIKRFFSRFRRALIGAVESREAPEAVHTSPVALDPVPAHAQQTVLTIKTSTVIRVALLVLLVVTGFKLVGTVIDVLLLVLIAVIIAAAVAPLVDHLAARGWPRSLTAALIFLIAIGLIVVLLVLLVPVVADQVQELARNITNMVQKLIHEGPQSLPFFGPRLARMFENVDTATIGRELQQPLQDLGRSLVNFTGDAVGAAGRLAVGLIDFAAVVILAFYMIVRRSSLEGFIRSVTPATHRNYAGDKYRRIVERMGAWMRAQLLVMLFVFLLSWAGFMIIGLPYALFLAILAGILAIVPVIGWITAGLLAFLLALTQSFWMVLGVIIVIALVHFADAYIFVPLVTESAVGLSPVAVIIALLVGFKLAGLLGVLLSVPIAAALATLFEDTPRQHARANGHAKES